MSGAMMDPAMAGAPAGERDRYAAAGLAAGRLRTVLDDWRPADEHFYLYYPSRKLLPAGLRAFVDMLHEHPPR